ncbi:hypothetical protein NPIL_407921 [Nephila pilipes]|uniref:Uncharacterized protein n=1 Tax=Nephila pilipes TaxID=299642 RepID=A0A8X6URH4_NEPPI|nr:hypothetical protein NPIL_407921 [Nephila pilipes]
MPETDYSLSRTTIGYLSENIRMKYPIEIPTKGRDSSIEIPLALNGNREGFRFGFDGDDCPPNQQYCFRFSVSICCFRLSFGICNG